MRIVYFLEYTSKLSGVLPPLRDSHIRFLFNIYLPSSESPTMFFLPFYQSQSNPAKECMTGSHNCLDDRQEVNKTSFPLPAGDTRRISWDENFFMQHLLWLSIYEIAIYLNHQSKSHFDVA